MSVRGHALAMPLVLNWSTPTSTSKGQEFGGLQPRDERSRNPSLGLPRVGGEPDRGRPVFSGAANWWRKRLAHSSRPNASWLHEQAAVGLRCRRFLELLKPSDPVGHLLTCFGLDTVCSCPSPERKVGRRQARLPDMRLWRTPTSAHRSAALPVSRV